MKTLLSALLLLALASIPAHAEDVYRTVKADGTVVYSDRPISPDSVLVPVQSRPAEAAPTESGAANTGRTSPGGDGDTLAAAREEQARLKAEACKDARRTLEVYENSPRLYEQLPNGGRRFLSDEETIQARQSAREAVADLCEADGNN